MEPIQTQILPDMIYKTKRQALVKKKLSNVANTSNLKLDLLTTHLIRTLDILKSEKKEIRPYDKNNMPGGVVKLKKDIPTLIISDLHSRRDYLINALFDQRQKKLTNLTLMAKNELQIVCLGDGMHSEQRGAKRWKKAFNEFQNGFKQSEAMDEEMMESFSTMLMIMQLKITCPENFHFLKGNHENILNEQGHGNHAFAKFAFEGAMVREYVRINYGEEFLQTYSEFEKNLPLLAVGKNFLITHAEPLETYNEWEIINFRENPDVIEGLTWTDNNEADKNSVQNMLKAFLPKQDLKKVFHFGGHRQVSKKYNRRGGGNYIQVNNPEHQFVIYVPIVKEFSPEVNIYDVSKNAGKNRALKTVKLA